MTGKVVLVLVLVTSIVAAQKRGLWMENAGLFDGKKDEIAVENGNVDGKRFFIFHFRHTTNEHAVYSHKAC